MRIKKKKKKLYFNPLVPKHRMHYQKTFIFHPATSFGNSNRKQGLNLCLGQRLLRLTCSIYATFGINFSTQIFLRVNNSSIDNYFWPPFWMTTKCMKKKYWLYLSGISGKMKSISQFLFSIFYCSMYHI